MSIKTEIANRKAKITKLHNEIFALQDACAHPNVDKTHHSDTGNWSKSDDAHWCVFKCLDCGKTWTENQ